ncbi:MAG: site-2 protease family protein [Nitrospirae bacterium]|nr:MAG: site-2 protease family protein [Nitrospirota bacterium]
MDAEFLRSLVIAAIPVLIAITFHEVAHGLVAYRFGDGTAKALGRLTLNPVKHIDIFGTVILPILLFFSTHGQFTFGYAKPVPVNPFNLRNPKRDMIYVSAAGPVMNILIAFISATLLVLLAWIELIVPQHVATKVLLPLAGMMNYGIIMNIYLAAFNLIPLVPLDGGRILAGILPRELEMKYSRIEPYGMIILLFLIFLGLTRYFVAPVAGVLYGIIKVFMSVFLP